MGKTEEARRTYLNALTEEAKRDAKQEVLDDFIGAMCGDGDLQDRVADHDGLDLWVSSLAKTCGGERQLAEVALGILNRLIKRGVVTADVEAFPDHEPAPLRLFDDGYRDDWTILQMRADLNDKRGFDVELRVAR